jgi:hypothetical protein
MEHFQKALIWLSIGLAGVQQVSASSCTSLFSEQPIQSAQVTFEWTPEDAANHSGNLGARLSPKEKDAITDYQGPESGSINNYLRGKPFEETVSMTTNRIALIDSALKNAPFLPVGLAVYRNEYRSPERPLLENGETGVFNSFTSSRILRIGPFGPGRTEAALHHKASSTPIVVEYKIVILGRNVRGLYLPSVIDGHPGVNTLNEQELLLERGLRYRVVETTSSSSRFALSPGQPGTFEFHRQTIEVWKP